MPVRLLSLILAATFTVAAANAQSLCDGKYDAAQEMLDAAYGKYETLYSGGDHRHRRDNIGATIDLYRMWMGLQDQHYRDTRSIYYGYSDDPLQTFVQDPEPAKALHGLLLINQAMTDPRERDLTDLEKYQAAVLADLYTSKGPELGWWLQMELAEGLSTTQELLAQRAQKDSGLDWLQITLEASYAPWAIAWHLAPQDAEQDYAMLHEYAAEKYFNGGGNAWAVAAFLFLTPDSPYRDSLTAQQADWTTTVETCEASASEFAAVVVSILETLRLDDTRDSVAPIPAFVQGEIRQILDYNRAAREVLKRVRYSWRNYHYDDLAISLDAENPDMQPVFNAIETYFHGTIDGLIDVHENHPLDIRTVRTLNLLSADDLAAFARKRDAYPSEKTTGLQVAFLRYVALGRDDEALEMTAEISVQIPEIEPQISAILSSRYATDVKLALIALTLPYQSVWWVSADRSAFPDVGIYWRGAAPYWSEPAPNGMDLPREFRTAQVLQRDIETWMLLPSRWSAYWGMRGSTMGRLDRFHARGLSTSNLRTSLSIRILPDRPTDSAFKFNELIAWPELAQLGPKTGLSRRISEVIISWVDKGSNNRVKLWLAPSDNMANALREVVHLNGHNDTTLAEEQHLGQRAFELLQLRFPDTEAAKSTRYWHRCSARCEE